MSSTRRAAPVDVFQDPPTPFDDGNPLDSTVEQRLHSALQPPATDPANQNIILEPSSHGSNSKSPLKRLSPQSSPQPNALSHQLFEAAQLPAPELSDFVTDSPTKKTRTSLPAYFQPLVQKPQKALFTTFPTAKPVEKENLHSRPPHSEGAVPRSDPIYGGQGQVLGKHAMSDAGPRDRHVKKQKCEETEIVHIPEPEDMPWLSDDGSKPPYSYATLIGMAILRAPNRRLTLAHIYRWISDTFSHYRNADAGWMNSIRHNLSLNQAFYKKERPKEEPGKGMYWHIQPGMEKKFLDKPSRRGAELDGAKYIQLQPGDGAYGTTAVAAAPISLPPKASRKIDSSRFPGENELSSDATLPASDPADQEEERPLSQMPPPSRNARSSPPAENMHSSPPVARHASTKETPTRGGRYQSHSRSGNRQKRVDKFKDSGFYSSIESSAPRGQQGAFPTSDHDHDRQVHKRGRAEEELARIRGSSYDPSPTKTKPSVKQPSIQLNLSSPLRYESAFSGFPPLTPGVKLSVPKKAGPTISPNTYLRRHRESVRQLVGTPAHALNVLPEHGTWSPAFTMPDESNRSHPRSNALSEDGDQDQSPELINPLQDPTLVESTFDDELFNTFFAQDSPLKNIKTPGQMRPGLQRASTTVGVDVFADVTDNRRNARLASPIRMFAPDEGKRGKTFSTSKDEVKLQALTDENDFWAVDLSSDGDDVGMDLTQGFQKIGGAGVPVFAEGKENAHAQGQRLVGDKGNAGAGATANAKPKRPALGRAQTNVF